VPDLAELALLAETSTELIGENIAKFESGYLKN